MRAPSDRRSCGERVQTIQEEPHSVYAGEDQPIIAGQTLDGAVERAGIIGRLDRDHRQFNRVRTERAQSVRQIARLAPAHA